MKIQVLCLSASAVMLNWYGSAAAQTVTTSPAAGSEQWSEVVVTAERRHTDLQTTPISATVISGGDLANLGVTAIDALQFATPGAVIDNFNAILPELAREAGATFIPMPAMPEHHTIDGIHLDAAGYQVWDKAVLGGIESVLCKSS